MTTIQAHKDLRQKMVHFNGYVFCVVLATVGMAWITGFWLWFVLAIPSLWFFGITSAMVYGAGTTINRLEQGDDTKEP